MVRVTAADGYSGNGAPTILSLNICILLLATAIGLVKLTPGVIDSNV